MNRRGAWSVVVGVLLVATQVAACSADGSPGDIADPGSPAAPAREARQAGAVPAEPPTQLRLPSGTSVGIRPAGTRSDGVLDVPAGVRRAGWWRGSARLGDPFGAMLLAGHVDSVRQGLGPYAELLEVRAGQRLRVRSQHLQQVFVVTSLRLVPQDRLRENRVLYGARGPSRITLVTCAPPFDAVRGGYQNLAVVTAMPASPISPRKPS